MRTKKTTNYRYTWNGANLAKEQTGEVVNTYSYDITGIHSADMNGTVNAYIKDTHGSVIGVTDDTGVIVNNYEYDAFGVQISGDSAPSPFGYCGEYLDNESGLIYLRNRYYDSDKGRFITEDPEKFGANWYSYCDNEPVDRIDYSGKRYVWIRSIPNHSIWWNQGSGNAVFDATNRNTAVYGINDGKGTFIENDRMYVWDEIVYNDVGYYVGGRMKAVNYALIYGQEGVRNPQYKSYGSNCTNFVSQCLYTGGFQMDSEWWYDFKRSYRENSAAWGVADNLYRYLINTKKFSVSYIPKDSDVSNVVDECRVGDVIAYNNWDDVAVGVINHTAIISKIENGVIFYCGNTNDRVDEEFTNRGFNGDIYIVHIKYPDE